MFHIQSAIFISVGNFPLIVMEARLDPELERTFAFFISVTAQSSVWLSGHKEPRECGDHRADAREAWHRHRRLPLL